MSERGVSIRVRPGETWSDSIAVHEEGSGARQIPEIDQSPCCPPKPCIPFSCGVHEVDRTFQHRATQVQLRTTWLRRRISISADQATRQERTFAQLDDFFTQTSRHAEASSNFTGRALTGKPRAVRAGPMWTLGVCKRPMPGREALPSCLARGDT